MQCHTQLHPHSFATEDISLDDCEDILQDRQPLSNAAGNSQTSSLATDDFYHDRKAYGHQADDCSHSVPTGSYSLRQSSKIHGQWRASRPPGRIGSSLGARRRQTRKNRVRKLVNPIADSPQYRQYREKQDKNSSINPRDAKWPPVLETAFLNALVQIPAMGRAKFFYAGKLHGRNELIQEYLWISYLESLEPGQIPDKNMKRSRKQISSHIQVLKAFFKFSPAFARYFPSDENLKPKNGFEVSYKNNPCLVAISEGRLPSDHYEASEPSIAPATNYYTPMKPSVFWLLIMPADYDEDARAREHDFGKGIVTHLYTSLSLPEQTESLGAIPYWRRKFPHLKRLQENDDLDCDIIHMDVSLNLMTRHADPGDQLFTRTEMTFQSGGFDDQQQWRVVTSLIKPTELYRDSGEDPPLESEAFPVSVVERDEMEVRIKVPFPAGSWADAFTYLTDIQLQYDENQRRHRFGHKVDPRCRPARDYVEQISMYQEVQSSEAPGQRFTRKAIILWTFQQAKLGEEGSASWRYVESTPPRRTIMSPSPQASHRSSADMNEHFGNFLDISTQGQPPDMVDPFTQGLATPPSTAGLQSQFIMPEYTVPSHPYMSNESMSFGSTSTMESEDTMMESQPASHIDSFLSNIKVSSSDYVPDPIPFDMYRASPDPFDIETTWANYAAPLTSTPHMGWAADSKQQWPVVPNRNVIPDTAGTHEDQWVADPTLAQDWPGVISINTNNSRESYPEQELSEGDKVAWLGEHDDEEKRRQGAFAEDKPLGLRPLDSTTDVLRDGEWAEV